MVHTHRILTLAETNSPETISETRALYWNIRKKVVINRDPLEEWYVWVLISISTHRITCGVRVVARELVRMVLNIFYRKVD